MLVDHAHPELARLARTVLQRPDAARQVFQDRDRRGEAAEIVRLGVDQVALREPEVGLQVVVRGHEQVRVRLLRLDQQRARAFEDRQRTLESLLVAGGGLLEQDASETPVQIGAARRLADGRREERFLAAPDRDAIPALPAVGRQQHEQRREAHGARERPRQRQRQEQHVPEHRHVQEPIRQREAAQRADVHERRKERERNAQQGEQRDACAPLPEHDAQRGRAGREAQGGPGRTRGPRQVGSERTEHDQVEGPREQLEPAAQELDVQERHARRVHVEVRRGAVQACPGAPEDEHAREVPQHADDQERVVRASRVGDPQLAAARVLPREVEAEAQEHRGPGHLLREHPQREEQRGRQRRAARASVTPAQEREHRREREQPEQRVVERGDPGDALHVQRVQSEQRGGEPADPGLGSREPLHQEVRDGRRREVRDDRQTVEDLRLGAEQPPAQGPDGGRQRTPVPDLLRRAGVEEVPVGAREQLREVPDVRDPGVAGDQEQVVVDQLSRERAREHGQGRDQGEQQPGPVARHEGARVRIFGGRHGEGVGGS